MTKQQRSKKEIELDEEIINSCLASSDELTKKEFPVLQNFSSAFIFNSLPIPTDDEIPEYVYINYKDLKKTEPLEADGLVAQWNLAWESGSYRYGLFQNKIPKWLSWLSRFSDKDIYLVPNHSFHRYTFYAPLYHLLPRHILKFNKLPLLKKGEWPLSVFDYALDKVLPVDFDSRLSQAFAYYIWPFLESGSKLNAFSSNDSIKVLAHNLDFWMPYVYMVAKERLRSFGRAPITEPSQKTSLEKLRKLYPDIKTERPLKGGTLWWGENEAKTATKELVNFADKEGNLRSILDAIKSNRLEDDFSDRWSYAKEDFERKLYKKRSKYKVNFVELKDTIPVQGPETEITENQCWEDFISLIDKKEKRIVVCIRDGYTKVGEISEILGYANHSPVSKALKIIQDKALRYIDNS